MSYGGQGSYMPRAFRAAGRNYLMNQDFAPEANQPRLFQASDIPANTPIPMRFVNAPTRGLPPRPMRVVSPDAGMGPPAPPMRVAAPAGGAAPNPPIQVAAPDAGRPPAPSYIDRTSLRTLIQDRPVGPDYMPRAFQQAGRQYLNTPAFAPEANQPRLFQPSDVPTNPPAPIRFVARPEPGIPPRPVRATPPDMAGGPPVPMRVSAPDAGGQPPAPQFNRSSPVSPTPQTPGQVARQGLPQVRGTDNAMRRAQQGAPPAPPTPTRGILKPGATPTVANLLEDVRAGVNDSGTIGLDRLTGAPMSVVQMQNQGRDIANQIVDESITRRALTDPRSLSPENRTGIAPINLMAEMNRRAEMEDERQAMQQRGAEWRATRPTSEQLRALQQSDREANAAMNLAKFGQRESPYQQRRAAERAEDRQRMRERMKQFEDIKYARIAMDRYGMAPTEELSLRAAMGAAPEAGIQFMGQKDLTQAQRDVARMQAETNKLKINTDRETQLKLKEMDNEARQRETEVNKLLAEGQIKEAEAKQELLKIGAETEAKKVAVLMEQAQGQSRVGAAQAIGAMTSNPAFASMLPPQTMRQIVGSLTGMMGVTGAPAASAPVAQTQQSAPNITQMDPMDIDYRMQQLQSMAGTSFSNSSSPSSIAWSMGSLMRNATVPSEQSLEAISELAKIKEQYDPAFQNPKTSGMFGTLGGNWRIYDEVINAPPGQKQDAFVKLQNELYYNVDPVWFNRAVSPGAPIQRQNPLLMQQRPAQMQRPIAPVIPVAPPMQQGRGIFDDASYMQMTEQQLRQGGF